MKAIWSVLFLAIAAAILGIAMLLVPAESRTDKFWISIGGLAFGVVALYVAFTFSPGPKGEQGGAVMRGMLATGSMLYFGAVIVLALVAMSSIAFNWLAVLHILAALFWVVMACFGALGAGAMAKIEGPNSQP